MFGSKSTTTTINIVPPSSTLVAVVTTTLATTATLGLLWIGNGVRRVRHADQKRDDFNQHDWKVTGLATASYWVRWINHAIDNNDSTSSCIFACIVLKLLKCTLVQPAVSKSIKLMKQVELDGHVPLILCNEQARQDMQERLDVYYHQIYNSPTLNSFGKILNYAGALTCLQNHYGLLQLGNSPEVQKQQVKEPVFIVAIARTGTTILHRTMACDHQRFRTFDACDMLCPLPSPAPRWDKQARAQKAKEADGLMDALNAIYPGWMKCMETMHGLRSSEADEDQIWYSMGLGHMYMDPLMRLYREMRSQPGGISKLESKQVAKYRYAWLSFIIKLHQHVDCTKWFEQTTTNDQQRRPCPTEHVPWLLKDPNHSAYLPELLEEFPTAKLIFTHRAPMDVLPSLAKLMVIFVSMDYIPNSIGSSSAEMGRETLKRLQHYIDGMVSFTKSQDQQEEGDSSSSSSSSSSPLAFQKAPTEVPSNNNNNNNKNANLYRRIDFPFVQVVQDIPTTIEIIYQLFYGHSPTDEARQFFQAYLTANERETHGNQSRSLEDFSLKKHEVEGLFQEYNDMFLSKW